MIGTKEERTYAYSMLRKNKLYAMLTTEQRAQFIDNLVQRVQMADSNMHERKQDIKHRLQKREFASTTLSFAFCWTDTPQGYSYWGCLNNEIETKEHIVVEEIT